MTEVNRTADGSLSLADLQTTVQQTEQIYGPLTNLAAAAGGNNTMTLTVGDIPANLAILEVYTGAAAPAKAGYTTICGNACMVASASANVAVYRKA